MRVRRRRRRILITVVALAYASAFAWLISPVLRPAAAPTPTHVPARPVKPDDSVAIAPLGDSKPLPATLPGAKTVVTATESESGGAEPGIEAGGEAEATSVVPETSEASASPEPSSPSPSETIINSEE